MVFQREGNEKGFFFSVKDQSKTQKMPKEKYLTLKHEKEEEEQRQGNKSFGMSCSVNVYLLKQELWILCKDVGFTRKYNQPRDLWEITEPVYTLWFL